MIRGVIMGQCKEKGVGDWEHLGRVISDFMRDSGKDYYDKLKETAESEKGYLMRQ